MIIFRLTYFNGKIRGLYSRGSFRRTNPASLLMGPTIILLMVLNPVHGSSPKKLQMLCSASPSNYPRLSFVRSSLL
jgi:hypothetical protein